jgi:hypothetical protein
MFPKSSRYASVDVLMWTAPDGRQIAYLRRRFLPPDSAAIPLAEHVVTKGERLDNITAKYLGDPEQFWRVCDANHAMKPDDLTADENIGQRLIIPVPQGS